MTDTQISPNAIYKADCLSLLERLESNAAKLVYLDPPFFKGNTTFTLQSENQYSQEVDFDGYLGWLSQVISEAYRVTHRTGNIIIHTEPRINSYIRLIAEDLFEKIEFTEIILRKPKRFTSIRKPLDEHEILLVCRKSNKSIWNPPMGSLDSEELEERFRLTDSRGRFTTIDLTQPVDRPNFQYSWKGVTPPP
jgi:DNA modification methylase